MPFTVVGVVSSRSSSGPVINNFKDYQMYAGSTAGTIFIPDVCWSVPYRYDEPQYAAVRATSTNDMTAAGDNVAKYLNENAIRTTKYKYESKDLLQQASDLQSLSESTNKQLIWIAAISLVVGGIGVMNIMLVSVTERTREIGLKIAIGAQQSRILWQFLTEAAVLTSMGGILGVATGIGLAEMMSHIMGTPVAISVPACIIAVAFSMVIGVVFGLVPAMKASKLGTPSRSPAGRDIDTQKKDRFRRSLFLCLLPTKTQQQTSPGNRCFFITRGSSPGATGSARS
ncbi:MAG: ABC transporter permease [Lachnospiraceae bacterium]